MIDNSYNFLVTRWLLSSRVVKTWSVHWFLAVFDLMIVVPSMFSKLLSAIH